MCIKGHLINSVKNHYNDKPDVLAAIENILHPVGQTPASDPNDNPKIYKINVTIIAETQDGRRIQECINSNSSLSNKKEFVEAVNSAIFRGITSQNQEVIEGYPIDHITVQSGKRTRDIRISPCLSKLNYEVPALAQLDTLFPSSADEVNIAVYFGPGWELQLKFGTGAPIIIKLPYSCGLAANNKEFLYRYLVVNKLPSFANLRGCTIRVDRKKRLLVATTPQEINLDGSVLIYVSKPPSPKLICLHECPEGIFAECSTKTDYKAQIQVSPEIYQKFKDIGCDDLDLIFDVKKTDKKITFYIMHTNNVAVGSAVTGLDAIERRYQRLDEVSDLQVRQKLQTLLGLCRECINSYNSQYSLINETINMLSPKIIKNTIKHLPAKGRKERTNKIVNKTVYDCIFSHIKQLATSILRPVTLMIRPEFVNLICQLKGIQGIFGLNRQVKSLAAGTKEIYQALQNISEEKAFEDNCAAFNTFIMKYKKIQETINELLEKLKEEAKKCSDTLLINKNIILVCHQILLFCKVYGNRMLTVFVQIGSPSSYIKHIDGILDQTVTVPDDYFGTGEASSWFRAKDSPEYIPSSKVYPLFDSTGTPNVRDIEQGGIGDCYLFAAMIHALNLNVDLIKNCFSAPPAGRENEIGVTMYPVDASQGHNELLVWHKKKKITIYVKRTVDEIKIKQWLHLTDKSPCWPYMIEKAYAYMRKRGLVFDSFYGYIKKLYKKTSSYKHMLDGGKEAVAFCAITGKNTKLITMRDDAALIDIIKTQKNINVAFHQSKVIRVAYSCRRGLDTASIQIIQNHAYACIGCMHVGENLYVKLFNPYNHNKLDKQTFTNKPVKVSAVRFCAETSLFSIPYTLPPICVSTTHDYFFYDTHVYKNAVYLKLQTGAQPENSKETSGVFEINLDDVDVYTPFAAGGTFIMPMETFLENVDRSNISTIIE
ncbi:MAG: hypothetical protein NkDv07_0118 [Candidatus Improbicoccus devescovinae]|nr:MAG: hypothetical protein NkDv07_0118 [Candidatus Improbicoccus devescovinae]